MTGTVTYFRNDLLEKPGVEGVSIRNITGNGVGLNANRRVKVNGWVAPLNRKSVVDIHVEAQGIFLDEPLRRALPPEAHDVVAMLDKRRGDGTVIGPCEMEADFRAYIHRDPSESIHKVVADVDLDIRKASGAFREFPYPLEDLAGRAEIHSNSVRLKDITARQGSAHVTLKGNIKWGPNRPVTPDLEIGASDVPIDQHLLDALPPEQRQWLEKLGIQGKLNVNGRIFLASATQPSTRPAKTASSQPSPRRTRWASISPWTCATASCGGWRMDHHSWTA